MQCNQAFCGNPFSNGPFCSSYNTPLQSNQSMYPEIVGEGQVTSITLPDGSVQFFFMPTLNWGSGNTTQCHQFANTPNPMFANNNYNIPPQCNNNGGSWFIRSILPFPQNVWPPNPRNEFPRLGNTDFSHNLNNLDFGYHVKFHNDAWSSTTDLVYFYPSLRQRNFVYTLPCKDKTVQIDTGPAVNNTVCHYEVVCSKPCHCTCSAPAPAAPMSLECLVDTNSTPKNNNMSPDDSCSSKQNYKRGREKKKSIMWACDTKPNIDSADKSITTYADEGCDCTPAGGRETQTSRSHCADTKPISKSLLKPKWIAKSYSGDSMSDECSCDDVSKKPKISEDKTAKAKSGQSMSIECSCDDLSKTPNNRSEDNTEANSMPKDLMMPMWTAKTKSGQSMPDECSCDVISKKASNRSHDKADAKPMHKVLLMPKWTAKSFSGDSITEDCSCDDPSKKRTRRVNVKNNKRCKPKKCDCGCDSDNSVSTKGGRGTPFTSTCSTCSSYCCTSVLKSKCSPKDVAPKASSENSASLCPDCELKDKEMRGPSGNPSSEKVSSEHLLNSSCLDCDILASTSDDVKGD